MQYDDDDDDGSVWFKMEVDTKNVFANWMMTMISERMYSNCMNYNTRASITYTKITAQETPLGSSSTQFLVCGKFSCDFCTVICITNRK